MEKVSWVTAARTLCLIVFCDVRNHHPWASSWSWSCWHSSLVGWTVSPEQYIRTTLPDGHLVTVIRKVVATVTQLAPHIQTTFSWFCKCLTARTSISSAEDSRNFTVRVLLLSTISVFLWRSGSLDLLSPPFLLSWSPILTSEQTYILNRTVKT